MFPALLLASSLALADEPSAYHHDAKGLEAPLDCEKLPCARVLPEAERFEPAADGPWQVGLRGEEVVGWVVKSTDVSKQIGYSGKPMGTLVGLDPTGKITGAWVFHHSEPILLLGIPEKELQDFVGEYAGRHATDPVQVGAQGEHGIDAISGATVTVLAENATVLESAHALGVAVGAVAPEPPVPGAFVSDDPWTWARLEKERAFGRIFVSSTDMGGPADAPPFLDLIFAVADAPQVGVPLLGEPTWRWNVQRLQPGEHLLVVLNRGSASFRGSGFVRGGLFDRIRLEQGLKTTIFRDHDYTRIGSPPVDDAPNYPEGALFVVREGGLDPGKPFQLVFLGSAYDGKGGFSRDFKTFTGPHRVPRSVYLTEGPDPEAQIWRRAWEIGWQRALIVGGWLGMIAALFAARRWTTGDMRRLQRLHTGVMAGSFGFLGLYLHVQPSVTQLLTLIGSLKDGWNWGLFLSDPVLWVSWIWIAVVTVIWGRGVFCGWACPYGSGAELLHKLALKLGIPEFELPDRVHEKARFLRYGVLAGLVAAFLHEPMLGERMAEIEPFKSTFFVPLLSRHPALIAWWFTLAVWSVFTYRPFCRYICPLGAGLAIPASVRISGPYRRDFCSKCKICTRTCEPKAIRPDGTIDPRECLSCMECEANWRDDQVCPPLVKARRDRERAAERDGEAA